MLNSHLYKRYLAQLLTMMSQIYSFADSWHPLLKVNWAVLTSSFQFWSVMTGQIILSWHHQVFYLKFTKLNKVIEGNNHELCQSMSQSYWHVCWRSEWNVVWVDMKINCYSECPFMGIQAFLTTPIMHLQQETERQLPTRQPKEVESSDASDESNY